MSCKVCEVISITNVIPGPRGGVHPNQFHYPCLCCPTLTPYLTSLYSQNDPVPTGRPVEVTLFFNIAKFDNWPIDLW